MIDIDETGRWRVLSCGLRQAGLADLSIPILEVCYAVDPHSNSQFRYALASCASVPGEVSTVAGGGSDQEEARRHLRRSGRNPLVRSFDGSLGLSRPGLQRGSGAKVFVNSLDKKGRDVIHFRSIAGARSC